MFSSGADHLPFERFRYWQGQLLKSRDFADAVAADERLRWWHNRSVHGAFGISSGFTVALPTTKPVLAVNVAPGIAYDAVGRMLQLRRARRVRLPLLGTGTFVLLLCVRAPGACERASAAPEFTWHVDDRLPGGDHVPIARLTVDATNVSIDKTFIPPTTRAFSRSHLAGGATVEGGTVWSVRSFESRLFGLFEFTTVVDTRPAGFTLTPHYIAILGGAELVKDDPPLVWITTFLATRSPTNFRFGVFLFFSRGSAAAAAQRIMRRAFVSWLGCQATLTSTECVDATPDPCGSCTPVSEATGASNVHHR